MVTTNHHHGHLQTIIMVTHKPSSWLLHTIIMVTTHHHHNHNKPSSAHNPDPLSPQALQWYPPSDQPLLEQLVRLNAALPRVLLWSCRSGRNLRKDLVRQNVLLPHEIDMVCAGKHPVTTLMTLMTMTIAGAHVTPFQRLAMDRNLTHLIDCMGDCETMLQTPIPLAYTRYVGCGWGHMMMPPLDCVCVGGVCGDATESPCCTMHPHVPVPTQPYSPHNPTPHTTLLPHNTGTHVVSCVYGSS